MNMKKIIIILMLSLTLFSCSKDKTEPTPTPPPPPPVVDCHCGSVKYTGGSWDTWTHRQLSWNYTITNNCTNAPWYVTRTSPIESKQHCRGYQW